VADVAASGDGAIIRLGRTTPCARTREGGRYRVPARRRTMANFSGNVMQWRYAYWNSLGLTREATLTGFEPVLPP
jgi:hypothetical protein